MASNLHRHPARHFISVGWSDLFSAACDRASHRLALSDTLEDAHHDMDSLLPGLDASNIHPLFVHFPIAFWVAATGAWSLAVLRRTDDAWKFGLWLHLLALLGAGAAIAAGYWATNLLGHDAPGHDKVHVHRDYMLIATGLAAVITGVAWWKREGGQRWRVGSALASLVLLGVMTLGADRGAELVYRYGVGVAAPATDDGHEDHGHDDHGDHDDQPHEH